MRGSYISECSNIAKTGQTKFHGYLKRKSTLMIYDRHLKLQSKWDKSFWARGYYDSQTNKKDFIGTL